MNSQDCKQVRTVLITGGCRSGKSRRALTWAESYSEKCFIATAQASDPEMESRIASHQRERSKEWLTIEEPLKLADSLNGVPAHYVVVIDCLTLWTSNWLIACGPHSNAEVSESDFWNQLELLEQVLLSMKERAAPVILVTNEVGWGIVPDNALARQFRDWSGIVNQRVARVVDCVELMVSGIATTIKG